MAAERGKGAWTGSCTLGQEFSRSSGKELNRLQRVERHLRLSLLNHERRAKCSQLQKLETPGSGQLAPNFTVMESYK